MKKEDIEKKWSPLEIKKTRKLAAYWKRGAIEHGEDPSKIKYLTKLRRDPIKKKLKKTQCAIKTKISYYTPCNK